MPICCHLIVVLAGLLAVEPTGSAQQSALDDGGGQGIAEILVVTASRIEESVEDSPMHVTVLDDRQLRTTAAVTVDDALRQIPGFSLFRRSSSQVAQPTTQGVSLRGIGPSGVSRTLVLLDGIPLNDPFGGWVYWSRVPLGEIERVLVAPGPRVGPYGSPGSFEPKNSTAATSMYTKGTWCT